jgi:hypothetical protein
MTLTNGKIDSESLAPILEMQKMSLGSFSAVRTVLKEWGDGDGQGDCGLFVLVNNAAQTLTESIQTETEALRREEHLSRQIDGSELQVNYRREGFTLKLRGRESASIATATDGPDQPMEGNDESGLLVSGQVKSSWMQTLHDIPYEDVISAHSVNTFTPLILCRELLPLMGSDSHTQLQLSNPTAYLNKPRGTS